MSGRGGALREPFPLFSWVSALTTAQSLPRSQSLISSFCRDLTPGGFLESPRPGKHSANGLLLS